MIMQLPHDAQPQRRTLWSRLRDVVSSFDHERARANASLRAMNGGGGVQVGTQIREQVQQNTDGDARNAILPFPIHGEALLVKLAEVLRNRIEDRGPDRNPLMLTMSRYPAARLWIDRTAYVEIRGGQSAYHVAIEAAPDTVVSMETTDFDTLVRFVMQYVAGRLSESTALGAAS
ncbi:hypothetical protein [Bradyrhizobium prioriisuperbiae]|uniref:hypothetical protein n=1 Tax=Bradyrhizobium prioriisuperbiae TaxID=2854389 RepID=UPI0028E45E3A|nr:hypothetical protein [Bradyrhizobium prioritasuperba]